MASGLADRIPYLYKGTDRLSLANIEQPGVARSKWIKGRFSQKGEGNSIKRPVLLE